MKPVLVSTDAITVRLDTGPDLADVTGRLKLGTWQQVVVINHDNQPRQRSVEVTLIGTV